MADNDRNHDLVLALEAVVASGQLPPHGPTMAQVKAALAGAPEWAPQAVAHARVSTSSQADGRPTQPVDTPADPLGACPRPACRRTLIAAGMTLDALLALQDALGFDHQFRDGDLVGSGEEMNAAARKAVDAIAYATAPARARRTCSWCHAVNVVTAGPGLCPTCGHRADVARLDCDCGQCKAARSLGQGG